MVKLTKPLSTKKKCRRGNYGIGKNCQQCCLINRPLGYRRCINTCKGSSSFGMKQSVKKFARGRFQEGVRAVKKAGSAAKGLKVVTSKIRSIDKSKA